MEEWERNCKLVFLVTQGGRNEDTLAEIKESQKEFTQELTQELESSQKELKQHAEASQKALSANFQSQIKSLLGQQLQSVWADWETPPPKLPVWIGKTVSEVTSNLSGMDQKTFQGIGETRKALANLELANRDKQQQGLKRSAAEGNQRGADYHGIQSPA